MRFGSLDALRGLFCIVVVLRHSTFTTGDRWAFVANAGPLVDYFFILSGFVMSHAFKQRILAGIGLRRYVTSRLGRIYPVHLFMILLWLPYVAVLAWTHHHLQLGALDPLDRHSAATLVSNLLLVQSLGIHDSVPWNSPSWSVSVEFYTYLVFYAVVVMLGTRLTKGVAATIAIAAYATLYATSEVSLLRSYDLGLVRCLGGFFAGVSVFEFYQERKLEASAVVWSIVELTLAGACYLAVAASGRGKPQQLLCFALFAILIYTLAVQNIGILSRLLNRAPLLTVGRLSYSIYMTHYLFVVVSFKIYRHVFGLPIDVVTSHAGMPLTMAVTPYANLANAVLLLVVLGFSYLTHRYVEEPWRIRTRLTKADASGTRRDVAP